MREIARECRRPPYTRAERANAMPTLPELLRAPGVAYGTLMVSPQTAFMQEAAGSGVDFVRPPAALCTWHHPPPRRDSWDH